jgi:transposase
VPISCAGIDWASREHAVCVIDEDGRTLAESRHPHTEPGIEKLIAALRRHGTTRVAIERPDGVLVDRMVEVGLEVFPIDPTAAKAMRRRWSASGRKSDAFDAFCLAQLVRTDSHRLRALTPDSDATRTLRALTRSRADLLHRRVEVVHRLRRQLDCFWPGPTLMFAKLESQAALAFLRLYPSPADASDLDTEGLAEFLGQHTPRLQPSAGELLDRLRAAPTLRLGPGETAARRMAVLGLVAQLETAVAETASLTAAIVEGTHAHPDGRIFLSPFKATDLVVPAQLIAGFGDDRRRYPDAGVLAAKAGVAPVAHQSGEEHVAVFRSACDHRLRRAVGALADATRRHNPWAGAVYAASRERGHAHHHALRVLGRAWVRVLWRCWQDGVPYDPERHGAMRRLGYAEGSAD